jgi:hypothetical protein
MVPSILMCRELVHPGGAVGVKCRTVSPRLAREQAMR